MVMRTPCITTASGAVSENHLCPLAYESQGARGIVAGVGDLVGGRPPRVVVITRDAEHERAGCLSEISADLDRAVAVNGLWHKSLLVSDCQRSGVGLDVAQQGSERGGRTLSTGVEALGKVPQLASCGTVALRAERP